MKKQYIIRKYVMASSAAEAIRVEKQVRVDDVWLDTDWVNKQEQPKVEMGYKIKKKRNARR